MLLYLCVKIMYARGGDGVRRSLVHDPRRVSLSAKPIKVRNRVGGQVGLCERVGSCWCFEREKRWNIKSSHPPTTDNIWRFF